jgi:hypothetical protein
VEVRVLAVRQVLAVNQVRQELQVHQVHLAQAVVQELVEQVEKMVFPQVKHITSTKVRIVMFRVIKY